jgi:hypothetical protein
VPDPYSGATGTTKQELTILNEVKQRQAVKGQTIGKSKDGDKEKSKKPLRIWALCIVQASSSWSFMAMSWS